MAAGRDHRRHRGPRQSACDGRAQTADVFRERAGEAASTIRHLQAFSATRHPGDLDPVFRKPEELERAAVHTLAPFPSSTRQIPSVAPACPPLLALSAEPEWYCMLPHCASSSRGMFLSRARQCAAVVAVAGGGTG